MKPLFTAVVIIFGIYASAQEFSLQGKVVDVNNQPISYANIVITQTDVETFLHGTSTDNNGTFLIENISKGNYKISASFIGYKTFVGNIDLKSNTTFPVIILAEDSETLDQVTVTANRPTITRKPDRLTFNIANTALTEGSTLQVLRSTPGVIVSESSINIKSAPATIFINNRRVQLTSDELIQLLESAPANSIRSIDVITNPPASYDADSGAVINIIMGKNLVTGYRGSISSNYTQGVFPRYNAATSHFFKNDDINFNINYSYTSRKINRDEETEIDYFDNNNMIDEVWLSSTNRNTNSDTHNLNLNFDYYIGDNSTLSLTSTALYVPYYKYSIDNNTIINDNNDNFQSRFTADNLSRDDKYNIGADLNFITNFKNEGRLSINSHFTTYNYNRDQNVFTRNFDINNAFTSDSEFNTLANQNTNIFTAKADYSIPLSDKSSFDAGVKLSRINTDSDITRFNIANGNSTIDPSNSNVFDYDESIFALYTNFSKSWNNWDLVLGLRAEQTDLKGFSPTLNQTNTQNYFEWFPNVSISHTFSDNFTLYGNYKRSIARPSYTDLNPFTFFLNENLVVEGNPTLQPTFKDHFVIGTNFYEHFTIESYYINYDGAISELPRQDNSTNILSYTPLNINKTVDFGFDFIFDINPTKNWNLYLATSFFNISEENNFGNQFVELDQWSNYSILSNNISFLKDDSLNVNLNLVWSSKNLQAYQFIDDRLFSEISISKRIFKDKGTISVSAGDLFNYQDQRASIRYLNQSNRNNVDIDNRFVSFGFRYKFGNTKLETNERTTDVDERDRLKDLN